jgi:hypothetical protein
MVSLGGHYVKVAFLNDRIENPQHSADALFATNGEREDDVSGCVVKFAPKLSVFTMNFLTWGSSVFML